MRRGPGDRGKKGTVPRKNLGLRRRARGKSRDRSWLSALTELIPPQQGPDHPNTISTTPPLCIPYILPSQTCLGPAEFFANGPFITSHNPASKFHDTIAIITQTARWAAPKQLPFGEPSKLRSEDGAYQPCPLSAPILSGIHEHGPRHPKEGNCIPVAHAEYI